MSTVFIKDTTQYEKASYNKMVIQKRLGERAKVENWTEVDASVVESALKSAVKKSDNPYHKKYIEYYNNGRLSLFHNSPIRAEIVKALSGKKNAKTTKSGKIDGRTKEGRALKAAGKL